jgi:hypothetical protein
MALTACGLSVTGASSTGDAVPAPDAATPSDASRTSTGDADVDVASSDATANDVLAPPPVDAGPCAACPAGTARALCMSTGCVAAHRVFASSTPLTANIGGVAGADARCDDLAKQTGLGGKWDAWLSTSSSSPSVRFVKAQIPYRLVTGKIIAQDWADLTDGTIAAPIDRDEKGGLVNAKEVWTGTLPNGAFRGGDNCNNFTSTSDELTTAVGVSDQAGNAWTHVYEQNCDRTEPRIYCFEQ